MKSGQLLTIMSDRHQVIKRALVSVENDVFFVCKPEEFDAATREGRQPICIGFNRKYIIDSKDDTVKP